MLSNVVLYDTRLFLSTLGYLCKHLSSDCNTCHTWRTVIRGRAAFFISVFHSLLQWQSVTGVSPCTHTHRWIILQTATFQSWNRSGIQITPVRFFDSASSCYSSTVTLQETELSIRQFLLTRTVILLSIYKKKIMINIIKDKYND